MHFNVGDRVRLDVVSEFLMGYGYTYSYLSYQLHNKTGTIVSVMAEDLVEIVLDDGKTYVSAQTMYVRAINEIQVDVYKICLEEIMMF